MVHATVQRSVQRLDHDTRAIGNDEPVASELVVVGKSPDAERVEAAPEIAPIRGLTQNGSTRTGHLHDLSPLHRKGVV
jgi:hypothetical protein